MTFPKSINTRANFEGEGEVNMDATQNQVGGAGGAQSEESEEDPDLDVQACKEKQGEIQAKIDDYKAAREYLGRATSVGRVKRKTVLKNDSD
jgi:hypothetical protein